MSIFVAIVFCLIIGVGYSVVNLLVFNATLILTTAITTAVVFVTRKREFLNINFRSPPDFVKKIFTKILVLISLAEIILVPFLITPFAYFSWEWWIAFVTNLVATPTLILKFTKKPAQTQPTN